LPKGEYVELKVYAITGEEVKSLVDGWLEEGFHTYIWDGRDQIGKKVASGIYIYSLKTGEQRLVKKMLLAK
jgi:flagellar hook assembly protein FlgD